MSQRDDTRSAAPIYESREELAYMIQRLRGEFDALAEDALGLCDQHISAEVRKEIQHRIIERIQHFQERLR